jgi:hypothetical protein
MHPSEANEHREIPCKVASTRALEQILLSLITVALPYVFGTVSGQVGEQMGSTTRSGVADLKLRASINLHGVPALSPAQFAKTPHRSVVVAGSITVDAPTGQYDETKLINLGTNRWSFLSLAQVRS